MDSNIHNRVLGRNNPLQLLKASVSAMWPKTAVPLLSKLLGNSIRLISSKIFIRQFITKVVAKYYA